MRQTKSESEKKTAIFSYKWANNTNHIQTVVGAVLWSILDGLQVVDVVGRILYEAVVGHLEKVLVEGHLEKVLEAAHLERLQEAVHLEKVREVVHHGIHYIEVEQSLMVVPGVDMFEWEGQSKNYKKISYRWPCPLHSNTVNNLIFDIFCHSINALFTSCSLK